MNYHFLIIILWKTEGIILTGQSNAGWSRCIMWYPKNVIYMCEWWNGVNEENLDQQKEFMLKLENFIKTFSTPDTHVSCTTDLKTESKMKLQMEKI